MNTTKLFHAIKTLVIVAGITYNSSASAQYLTITPMRPDTVYANHKVELIFNVKSNDKDYYKYMSDFNIDLKKDDKNIRLVSGPNTSISHTYHMADGKLEDVTSVKYSYEAIFLEEGDCDLPQLSIVYHDKEYVSSPDKITVLPHSELMADSENIDKDGSLKPSPSNDGKTDTTYVTSCLSDTCVDVGKAITYETFLYTNETVIGVEMPSFSVDYCYYENTDTTTTKEFEPIKIGEDSINRVLLEQYKVYPLTNRDIDIRERTLMISYINKSEDLYESVFGKESEYGLKPIEIPVQRFSSVLNSNRARTDIISESSEEVGGRWDAVLVDVSSDLLAYTSEGNLLDMENTILKYSKQHMAENAKLILFANRQACLSIKDSVRLDTAYCRNLYETIGNGTSMYDAVATTHNIKHKRPKRILLISNGNDNNSHINVQTLSEIMRRENIIVDGVGISLATDSAYYETSIGDTITVKLMAQPESVEEICKLSGGNYVSISISENIPAKLTPLFTFMYNKTIGNNEKIWIDNKTYQWLLSKFSFDVEQINESVFAE